MALGHGNVCNVWLPQLDDRYSLWRLEGGDELDLGLRSPRQPGGHAAVGDSPDAPSP
jgi:hypothetical protein